jgi:protein TonB
MQSSSSSSFRFTEHYSENKSKTGQGLTIPMSLLAHGIILAIFVVYPLLHVADDLPKLEAMATFVAAAPPPPPPPPPPPAPAVAARSRGPIRVPRPTALVHRFFAPATVPDGIVDEVFEGSGVGVPAGIPGGIPGGIIGGIPAAPPTEEPVRLDFREEATIPTRRVEPVYPTVAIEANVGGVVVLEVLVGSDGVPHDVKVLRGHALLQAAGIQAVQQWHWKPHVAAGREVPFLVTVTVNFQLQRAGRSS